MSKRDAFADKGDGLTVEERRQKYRRNFQLLDWVILAARIACVVAGIALFLSGDWIVGMPLIALGILGKGALDSIGRLF
jgi:hypothetical protein